MIIEKTDWSEMTADKMAKANLLAYEGDVGCLEYGGTFFNLNRDHRENGYIEAIRIEPMGEHETALDGVVLVESLTIIVDDVGSDQWQQNADYIGLEREAYDELDERGKCWADASASLSYGHYDPACMGHEYHTQTLWVGCGDKNLDSWLAERLDACGMAPDVICTRVDDDGDEVIDEGAAWEAIQDRMDATFTDLSDFSGDNLMADDTMEGSD